MKFALSAAFLTLLSSTFPTTDATDTALVRCGNGSVRAKLGCTPKLVPKTEKYGVRCCSQEKFYRAKKRTRGPVCNFYAGSVTNIASPGLAPGRRSGEFCPNELTFDQAKTMCKNMGAEMCTEEEMRSGCTKVGGCNMNRKLVWVNDLAPTSSPTEAPTESPTKAPTESPTKSPTKAPTDSPTMSPTMSPTGCPNPFLIIQATENTAVNLAGGSCADGTDINLATRDGSSGQIFCYDPTNKAIVNMNCNKVIAMPDNPNCDKTGSLDNSLTLQPNNGLTSRGWTVLGQGITGDVLQNIEIRNEACTNNAFDWGGDTVLGYKHHGGWNQKWNIEYVTEATESPTKAPTKSPTKTPTESPTKSPTESPTESPTKAPTKSPTKAPTKAPTDSPTMSPTMSPTGCPNPFLIIQATENTAVNLAGGSCADGTDINLATRDGSSGQIFCYDPTNKAIVNMNCNKVIAMPDNPNCDKTGSLDNSLTLQPNNGLTSRGWTVLGQGITGDVLQNIEIRNEACTNNAFDWGGDTVLGYKHHGGWNQKWNIEYV